MVARKAGRKCFLYSVCACARVVGAKPNRVILGPSSNHASMRIIRPGFSLLEVFICINPLGDRIRR